MSKQAIPDEVMLQKVKDAVRKFELENTHVSRTVLMRDDQSIDFDLLKPFIDTIPEVNYYMSRETFEIFAEEDRDIPVYLDIVQRAVDKFMYDHKRKPVVPSDYYERIDFKLLVTHQYLEQDQVPPFPLYMTDLEDLITHKRPE